MSFIPGSLFTAAAFVGASEVAKIFHGNNSEWVREETRRHNLATEKLAKAQEAWREEKIEEENKYRRRQQEIANANADFNNINKSFKEYKKVMEIVHNGKSLDESQTYGTFTSPQTK